MSEPSSSCRRGRGAEALRQGDDTAHAGMLGPALGASGCGMSGIASLADGAFERVRAPSGESACLLDLDARCCWKRTRARARLG